MPRRTSIASMRAVWVTGPASGRSAGLVTLRFPFLRAGAVQELVAAIDDYLAHYNADPKPFVWSTTVDAILDKVRKCKVIPGTDP
jgi:hypothetical protein